MDSYAILAIPVGHANAINRVFNLINQDSGDNLAQPLGANGQEPATYKYGGWNVTPEQVTLYQTLADNLPTPEGGWPYNDVTEQDAIDAASALEILVRSGPDGGSLPGAARDAMFAELGVAPIEEMP